MFETFNVPGLYFGVQPVLALYAGFAAAERSQQVRGWALRAWGGEWITAVAGTTCFPHGLPLTLWLPARRRAAQGGGEPSLTGTVIDAGDGVAHVVPVMDGYVEGSAIRSVPIGGRDVTLYLLQQLRCACGSRSGPCLGWCSAPAALWARGFPVGWCSQSVQGAARRGAAPCARSEVAGC